MSTSTVPYQQNPYTPGSSSTVIQCYRCGDTCKGEVVRVQSNHFHIRCFTCQVCGCDLAQSGFFFKNQEYICTHDYQQLYGTRCDSCGDFITGEVISALGRTYHPKCFVCSTCRKPFPIGDKVTFSGKDCVCQNCSHSLISTKPIKIHGPSHCAGCKEEIKQGQSLLALEKQWHVSCFKCQTCGIILTGEYISKDGVPYCESDYHAQFGIKCETCNGYISGRVLEAGGKHYHPTCARCVRCHQMFTEGEEMYLTGSEVWHPICKQAARAEKKLKHRRTSETSISPPGSSIGSPNRVICAKVDNEILNYKDLAALPKIKAIYEVQRPDLISYEPYHRYMSDETLERYSYGEDIYESFDMRQRRASSPGYIDSPTYSRQGMSPTMPRSPHHFYRSGTESGRSSPYYSQLDVRSSTPTSYQAPKHFHIPAAGESNIYRKPPIYKRHDNLPAATKSKTSEDIAQSSKYSPAYSPDPYYHSESEYWSFQGSPKAPRARRFSSGGEEDGYDRGMHKIQSSIGRLILREEMKARSNSYADPWTPPRSSASSREALHTAGYEGSLNGSPRTHYLADSDPLISKSASLPAYRRNGLHRPPSAELFHYDSTNAVNWGMREYKVRCSHSKERLPAGGASTTQRKPQRRACVSPGPSGGSFALCPQCPTFLPLDARPESPVLGLRGSDQRPSLPARVPSAWLSRSLSPVRKGRGWLCSWFLAHTSPWVSPGFEEQAGDLQVAISEPPIGSKIRVTQRASPPLPCPIHALGPAVSPKHC
ncbi:actin-binding LIM protein 3 isoform X4 [Nyctibius grandis]|uniref:actin-binding LIM protein 3 isoform X4 n=1 Tax=Nyctibius grandis TaxID=48427 RepID=UPI0035BC6AC2